MIESPCRDGTRTSGTLILTAAGAVLGDVAGDAVLLVSSCTLAIDSVEVATFGSLAAVVEDLSVSGVASEFEVEVALVLVDGISESGGLHALFKNKCRN